MPGYMCDCRSVEPDNGVRVWGDGAIDPVERCNRTNFRSHMVEFSIAATQHNCAAYAAGSL